MSGTLITPDVCPSSPSRSQKKRPPNGRGGDRAEVLLVARGPGKVVDPVLARQQPGGERCPCRAAVRRGVLLQQPPGALLRVQPLRLGRCPCAAHGSISFQVTPSRPMTMTFGAVVLSSWFSSLFCVIHPLCFHCFGRCLCRCPTARRKIADTCKDRTWRSWALPTVTTLTVGFATHTPQCHTRHCHPHRRRPGAGSRAGRQGDRWQGVRCRGLG